MATKWNPQKKWQASKQLAAAMFLYCGESSGQLIRLLTPGVNITINKNLGGYNLM